MAKILMAAYTNYRRDPRVRREAEALVGEGHEVVFMASRQPGEPNEESISGVRVVKLAGLGNSRTSIAIYIAEYLAFFAQLSLHLTIHPRRYDLIHVNNMPDFLVLAAWMPRLLGTPVIHDVHDLMPELYSEKFRSGDRNLIVRVLMLQERLAGNFASAVLTVEERLREILARRGIDSSKIHVLMNLPDDRIFRPRPEAPQHAPGKRFVAVYHGTLAHRLGLDLAIRAIAKVKETVPGVELRIIGAGEERPALIRLRDELRLEENVTFSAGFVPVQDIPAMIADADIGLIPLRPSSGTDIMLPTKLLEYVNMGIPCVTPKTGTISRYFDDQMVQFFQAEDVDSLAQAIIGLQQNAGRRESLAREATRRFGSIYAWSQHKQVYIQVVERLLDARRAPVTRLEGD
jgi:glycosyltransferase involved in cell wall biosynthesis